MSKIINSVKTHGIVAIHCVFVFVFLFYQPNSGIFILGTLIFLINIIFQFFTKYQPEFNSISIKFGKKTLRVIDPIGLTLAILAYSVFWKDFFFTIDYFYLFFASFFFSSLSISKFSLNHND